MFNTKIYQDYDGEIRIRPWSFRNAHSTRIELCPQALYALQLASGQLIRWINEEQTSNSSKSKSKTA